MQALLCPTVARLQRMQPDGPDIVEDLIERVEASLIAERERCAQIADAWYTKLMIGADKPSEGANIADRISLEIRQLDSDGVKDARDFYISEDKP